MTVTLTDDMFSAAQREVARREGDIEHHFKTSHYEQHETSVLGFLGEFAFATYLGLDWRDVIRPSYETIDRYDIELADGRRIDVKTESIPKRFLQDVVERTIRDDGPYGRRLVHVGQASLLEPGSRRWRRSATSTLPPS
jgi:hypothetical protein